MAVTESAILKLSIEATQAQQAMDQLARKFESAMAKIRNSFAMVTAGLRQMNAQINGAAANVKTSFASANQGAQQFSNTIAQSATGAATALATIGTTAKNTGQQLSNLGAGAAQGINKIRRSSDDLGASIFRFRENITGFANGSVNAVARVFRGIARLRTAFFLLLTVLAVRPILRFFQSLAEYSASAALVQREFAERWERFLSILGEKAAPMVKKFFDLFIKYGADAMAFLAEASGPIRAFFELADIFKDAFSIAANALVIVIDGLKAIMYGGKAAGNAIAFAFSKAFETVLTSLSKVADYLFEKLRQIHSGMQSLNDWGLIPDAVISSTKTFLDTIEGIGAFLPQEFAQMAANASAELAVNTAKFEQSVLSISNTTPKLIGSLSDLFVVSDDAKNAYDTMMDFLQEARSVYDSLMAANQVAVAQIIADLARLGAAFILATKKIGDSLTELASSITRALEDGFSDVFLNIMEFRFNKFRDIVVNTLEAIKKSIANFIAQRVVAQILGGAIAGIGKIGSYFNNSSTGGADFGTVVTGSGELVPIGGGGGGGASVTAIPVSRNITSTGGGGGGTINIYAMDSQDVARALTKNRRAVLDIVNEAGSGGDLQTRTILKRR